MYRTKFVILAVAAIFIAGCAEDKHKTKEDFLKDGIVLMDKKNNPGGAIVLFKTALEKDQSFFDARFQLAKAYFYVGKFDSAERELHKVSRQNPASRDVHIELARVYLQKAEPDKALKETAEFIGYTSSDADALEIAGRAYAEKGNYSAAVNSLKKALSINNAGLTAFGELSRTAANTLTGVYMKMGKIEEAKSQISEILKRDPSDRNSLYSLAKIQTTENNIDAAIKTYEDISRYHPSDIEALDRKGMLHIAKSNYDEALLISDKLIETFSNRHEGYRLKGIGFFYQQNFADATIALQKSLSLQHDISAYYFLGLCHYYRNELEQAMSQLQRVLELNPSFAQARVLSSLILLKKNRWDDAVSVIKQVLENNEKNAFAHNILGSAYMAKGMYAEGIEEFNRAIENDPKLVDVHIKKGLFELSKDRFKGAETELNIAVQIAPELLYSRVILASYYLKRNEHDKAINILKKGIKGRNTDALFYNLIAEALSQQNKIADAVRYLRKAKESNPEYYISYFNLATLYFLKGEHDRGVQELKSLIIKSPDNLKALLNIASILETKGKDEEALEYYIQAKATGETEGYIRLAKYHLRKKESDKALRILDDAISKNPSDTLPYEFKGKILISAKRFKEAVRTFEKFEKINPKLGLTYIINAYTLMNKPKKALYRLRKEIKKNPERLDLTAEVSRIYRIMGRKQDAVKNAEQIMRNHPESPIGYMTLAMLYQKDKAPDKAMSVLRKASWIKDINLTMMLGNLYLLKKDYTLALDQYRKAEVIKSGYIPAIFQQGAVHHAIGKKKEAITDYQRILRFSLNHVPTLNNLAYLYAEDRGDLAKALQLAMRAYTLSPENGFVQDTLGFVLLRNGKIDEGLTALKKAAELLPANPSIYYHIALAYKESGNKARAIENLQRALELGGFSEASHAKLLLGKLQRG